VLAMSGTLTKEKTMRCLLVRLGSFLGFLALSGAVRADTVDMALPEPGALGLVGIAAVAGIVATLIKRHK
jgi:ABC-type cobalamin transport system permease subunit